MLFLLLFTSLTGFVRGFHKDIDFHVPLNHNMAATLQCPINKTVSWYKIPFGENIEATTYKLNSRPNDTMLLHDNNPNLTINGADSVGVYFCLDDAHNNYTFAVSFLHLKRLEPSITVTEGDSWRVACLVKAYPPVKFRWLIQAEDMKMLPAALNLSSLHLKLTSGAEQPSEELSVDASLSTDRAYYICEVFNFFANATTRTLVRVRSKYAAVWPFLGIVAEVTILCCIIFACEKRRTSKNNGTELGDEEDESIDHKTVDSNNESIRYRK